MKWAGKIDFDSRPQYDADGLITNIEVDTISGSLQSNIDSKSGTSHIHDDRYYTESEVDDLITTISGKLDDHNELNNLDYASSGHTGFQPSGDYATNSELTSVSGALQTNIDVKADTVHTHDDRYYIESEIDTISGSLNTKIDGKSDTSHLHDARYYTESEIDTISGSLQTNIDGKSDTAHLHDDRYYTESEVDTISGSLQTNIDGKSDTSHLHDDRYYTESEVDDLITTISGKLDDHNELNNLDYASSGHTGFQPAGDYTTTSELTSMSGILQTNIDEKSDTGHLHDDRYYTESEVDTISGSLQTDVDTKSDTSHLHDDRYYTESETDTISGSLQTNIDGKSDTSHTHDDRYYTESEIDDLITTISGKLDDHNELNNLDYASSGHTGFQPTGDYLTDSEFSTYSGTLQSQIDNKSDAAHLHDDRYYTESEVDTISGSLQIGIDTKSNISHLHDDRYYTESEVDTISGSLQTNIDGKSDTAHLHDDRYYTESEVDDLITTISGKLDDHNELNNLDYASSGHTGFQPAGNYATDSELTSVSGVLQTNIDGKSDTSHLHDDRYYTETELNAGQLDNRYYIESEVDTISGSLQINIDGKADISHLHDDRYYTESEVDTVSGSLNTKIDGKSDTVHTHTESDITDLDKYTQSEVDTISGSLQTNIDGKSDTSHIHDDRYYTETEVDTISGSLNTKIDGKSDTSHTHDDRYYTESEVDTISGSLDTKISAKPDTLLELSDTPVAYDNNKYLKSTTDGTEWVTVSGGSSNHAELSNLTYASSGHTGFSPTSHSHTESDISDLDKYTQAEVDTISGTLSTEIDSDISTHVSNTDAHHNESHTVASHSDTTATGANLNELVGSGDTSLHKHDNIYYTETEVDTISGSLQAGIDGDKPASEIIVSTINTPTYNDIQDWINNTQSSGRMSGSDTSTHTDTVTGVTVSGAGSGEFKVSGDQTAGYLVGEPILVSGSTNNDGYYTVASGVAYSGGTTTVPVDEAVGAIADGSIENGTVDVSAGTGFIKQTDSDIGETVSFNIHADTNITLTDLITNYVYVDNNGGNPDIKVTTDRATIEWNRQFPLSMVYRNGARTWVCSCGIYLPNKTRLDHERVLTLRGYERATGGEISEYGTRNIQSTAGVFYRGSNEISTTVKASVDDKLTTVYYDGSAWVWTEEETQIDNTYYNNIASGLVELGTSKYAVHWVCIDYLSNLYVVYGRGSYSLSEAQLAGVPSLMPVIANEFGIVAAKVIIQKTASLFTELISAYTQLIPTTTPAVHNNLSGLNEGDYKHLTVANHTDLTDSGDCSIHKHDDRYYTESEVDTISGSLQTNIDGKSDTSHTHDDRYYTESEVDTISGSLNTKIDGKSDTSHTHDDRYYTDSEVDTISGSLNTKIDTKADLGVNSDITSMTGLDDDGIPVVKIDGALANVSEDSTPDLGGQLGVGENDIKFDALLSADGKYSGSTRDGVLGDTLAFGDLVYLNTTNQRWEKTDADTETTSGDVDLAIVLAAGNDGDTKLLLIDGFVREDDWNFTSYGQSLFVSTTSGTMTQTVVSGSGDIVRTVGKAGTTADQIRFKPSQTWIELS